MKQSYLSYIPSLVTGLLVCCRVVAAAPTSVIFSKQVLPVFQKECSACHGANNPAASFRMDSRDALLRGGRRGSALVLGKGAESSLVRYMLGELKPKMPPNGAVDLETISLIRRWIDEGAKVDSFKTLPTSSAVRPAPSLGVSAAIKRRSAPVTSLVYSPDGKRLAIGRYRYVSILNSETGTTEKTLSGLPDQALALAWSADGKRIAAAGGVAGVSGEIAVFELATGQIKQTLIGHSETVSSVAWKPNSDEIATGSLDKSIKIWDAESGKCIRTIKEHADTVLSVAYSQDGKWFASGSADRTAKLFDAITYKRTATLSAHQDAITSVAFKPDSTMLATAGADKQMKMWPVKAGTIENPVRAQGEGDTINACSFCPNNKLMAWGASNKVVKVWSSDGANQLKELKGAEDWVYCVAISADGKTVIAGTQDSKLIFWEVETGKIIRQIDAP